MYWPILGTGLRLATAMIAVKALLLLAAGGLVACAALLWRDPALIDRPNWFTRRAWGNLERARAMRPIAIGLSALAALGAVAIVALVFA